MLWRTSALVCELKNLRRIFPSARQKTSSRTLHFLTVIEGLIKCCHELSRNQNPVTSQSSVSKIDTRLDLIG
jgi:hypothetical protein